MCVCLPTKFQVSSIILTSFRQSFSFSFNPPPPTSIRTPKKLPLQIRLKQRSLAINHSIVLRNGATFLVTMITVKKTLGSSVKWDVRQVINCVFHILILSSVSEKLKWNLSVFTLSNVTYILPLY